MKTRATSSTGPINPDVEERLIVRVVGMVQGVGFRPFVYQLAVARNLYGWVSNTSGDVRIEVEGSRAGLGRFLTELRSNTPPMARIKNVTVASAPPAGYISFEIRPSLPKEGNYQLISPDIATCPDCLHEVFDSENRRYLYPFTNCTNCGPRFTIIEDIPYDRPMTTMRAFMMCPQCRREYENPLDRRFHAQPNACPVCGPRLELVDAKGRAVATNDVLSTVSRLLQQGKIVAVKGLGGFLLACDATNDEPVRALRERKRRPAKPFAIMLANVEEVRRYCTVSPAEEALLTSPQSPIVLLQRGPNTGLSSLVAPSLKYLGVMLPYTPLHHILMHKTGLPLVMTSGNLSEEPIAKDNDEALWRLRDIADYFLLHNRDIYARYDDSVQMVVREKPQVVRRARGLAPFPIQLPFKVKQVLACGPELKNTVCLTRDDYAFLSQHIGDMENLETLQHFESTIEVYQRLFRVEPEVLAYDMHPEYLSTKYGLERAAKDGLPTVPVQHHHAHIAACMADNGVTRPVIGVAFDGTGYGTDGCIWGGEFLLADYSGFRRLGHLQYMPMPGGSAAINRPYRMAISYLFSLFGDDALDSDLPFLRGIDPVELELVGQQIRQGINSPLTSSCGRLFDAVSALIGVRGVVDYEAQGAIELEMIADSNANGVYPLSVTERNGVHIAEFGESFEAIMMDMRRGVTPATISGKFHRTMAAMIADVSVRLAKATGITTVALSGGVFQNRLLLELALMSLEESHLEVLVHHEAPANDGGVSLGQAAIAGFSERG